MPRRADELETLGDKVKGAWFLVSGGGGFFGPRINRRVRRALIEKGAGGLITRSRDLLVTGGSSRVRWDRLPTLPRVDMIPDHYNELRDLLEDEAEVEVEFDIRNYFKKGPIKLYNVVAELKGTQFPDEYVIVGGHIDSWDGATGTTDNGTGVATTIEAARLLAKAGVKPRRTIRFMLWGGEEQGLLGSKAYIKNHPEENERISAVLVHDGGTNYISGIAGLPAMMPALKQAFQPVLDADLKLPFRVRQIRSFFPIGSDHDSYLAAGVPGFFWRQSGKANYRRTHHTQHDTFDSAIQEYQKHTSVVAALGALGIANLDQKLSREGFRYVSRRMRIPTNASGGRRVLGVMTDETTITQVVEGYPAKKAGLRAGDVILQVDDAPLKKGDDLSPALQKGGKTKRLLIRRGKKEMAVEVEFKE